MFSEDTINYFVYFVVVVKLAYTAIWVYNHYERLAGKKDEATMKRYERYENALDLIVLLSLGILLMMMFNPYQPPVVKVHGHLKTSLYLLGFILIFSLHTFWRDVLFKGNQNQVKKVAKDMYNSSSSSSNNKWHVL